MAALDAPSSGQDGDKSDISRLFKRRSMKRRESRSSVAISGTSGGRHIELVGQLEEIEETA
jgi:hypothetical protein